jgi:serine/threonine protein kinase
MKVFPSFENDLSEILIPRLYGLYYEGMIYENVIKEIQEKYPFFVKCKEFCKECKYEDLMNILKGKVCDDGNLLSEYQIDLNLKRNIYYILTTDKYDTHERCKPIQIGLGKDIFFPSSKNCNKIVNKTKYSYILMEKIDGIPLSKFYDEQIKENCYFNKEVWNVIFQLVIACYGLNSYKTNHKDLHVNNIYVKELKEPEILEYEIGDKKYNLVIKNKVVIYDFDRSSCEKLGENKLLNCKDNYRNNRFVEVLDIIKVLFDYVNCIFLNFGKNESFEILKDKVLDLVLKNTSFVLRKYYESLFYDDNVTLSLIYNKEGILDPKGNVIVEIEDVYCPNIYCKRIEEIIDAIYELI